MKPTTRSRQSTSAPAIAAVALQPARQRADEASTTDGAREHDDSETGVTYQAAAVYVANKAYDEALTANNPAAMLDDISGALPEILPEAFKTTGTASDLAAVLLPAIADRIRAFTAVAHARADIGGDYGYVLDVLADSLKRGADPQAIRAEVPRVVERVRIERTIAAAADAITAAVTTALDGLTTHRRDVAERLHTAIDAAQAEHLALPTVGDMSLERAESAEAFSTATYAMAQALKLSPDPEGTAQGLRTALRMVIDEARG
ncbi:hypothetical protein ABZ656_04400 [Streptomyces sp. NPDC007095]|uniref:hypothetical protein n=1 Tax=Streptomyces sp. NPDC007095 TaxID=3154482 RepID=UPI00340BECB6